MDDATNELMPASLPPSGMVEDTSSTEGDGEDERKAAERLRMWEGEIARSELFMRERIPDWALNIDYRRGKPFAEDSDQDRIQVPIDWAMTKAKQAQLFSQVPEVRLTERNRAYMKSVGMFAKKVNTELAQTRIGVAFDECLPDAINAAGIAAILTSYEARTEKRQLPVLPPDVHQAQLAAGQQPPMKDVDVVLDSRFTQSRISPGDLLLDMSFVGSDFNDGKWIGRKGRTTWSDSKVRFGLTDDQKATVVGGDTRTAKDLLAGEDKVVRNQTTDTVEYKELFYWRHLFHEDETDYRAIHHIVFVRGVKKPVIDEPWKGQKRAAAPQGAPEGRLGKVKGARIFPIQVLTLTYISDEAVPPSDTAMGRPQTDEINKSRGQMIRNRENSLPLRWMNTNLVDPQVQTQLLRGTWQGIVPLNGDGSRAIGEVARANYPNEDFNFNNIAMQDVREVWQVEDAVGGGPAIRSAAEANNRQNNFQTRIGYERARCAKFFVRNAEVLAGLLSLFGNFDQEELATLQQGQAPEDLSDSYAFNVRADSTLLIEAGQRIEKLFTFLNMTAKSGYVDVMPVIAEIAELNGLDPAVVMKTPPEKGPEPVSISIRLTGADDLNDAFVIAMLIENKQAPSPESINQAKMLLASIPQQPTAPPPDGGPEGAPDGAAPPAAGAPPAPGSATPPPTPTAPGGRIVRPAAPYSAHPDWNTASRIEKRAEDGK